jgi:hypothetical protein
MNELVSKLSVPSTALPSDDTGDLRSAEYGEISGQESLADSQRVAAASAGFFSLIDSYPIPTIAQGSRSRSDSILAAVRSRVSRGACEAGLMTEVIRKLSRDLDRFEPRTTGAERIMEVTCDWTEGTLLAGYEVDEDGAVCLTHLWADGCDIYLLAVEVPAAVRQIEDRIAAAECVHRRNED